MDRPEAEARASAATPATAERLAATTTDRVQAHPGEHHTFRIECERCGQPGYLNVALVGPDERFAVQPLADPESPDARARLSRLIEAVAAKHDPMPWFRVTWDPHDIPSLPWLIFGGGPDDSTDEPAFGGSGATFEAAVDSALTALADPESPDAR